MSVQNINIKCPSCQTVYSVPAGKIGEKGRKIRCSVCNHRFVVRLAPPKPKPASAPVREPIQAVPTHISPKPRGGFEASNETPFDTAYALEGSETTHIPSLHESLEMEGQASGGLSQVKDVAPKANPAADLGINPFQEDVTEESSAATDAFEALLGGEGTTAVDHDDFAFDEPDVVEAPEAATPLSAISGDAYSGIDDEVSFGDLGTEFADKDDDSLASLSSMHGSDTDVTGAFLSSDYDDFEGNESSEESDGMVEFFVEDKEGKINRFATRPSDEALEEEVNVDSENPSRAEMARRRAVLTSKVEALESKEDVVGTKRYEMKGDTPIYMDKTETGSKIEMPKFSSDDASNEDASREIELPAESAEDSGERWVNPMKARKAKSSLLVSESDAAPSSGTLYNIILILLGLAGISTNMIDLGTWNFDMIWSLIMLGMGAGGFILQNFSGVYIAGFFSLFYSFGVFSHQLPLVAENRLEGMKHIAVFLLIALIFLGTYFLLTGRKKGTPIVKEGSGQSLVSLGCGIAAMVLVLLNLALNLGVALGLNLFIYYGGLDLVVILQVAALSMAMAIGLSAVKVHNNQINMAYAGFGLGLATLLVLYFTGTF